ncbi:hypothetical protein HGA91_05475 [candidate division WWE3 bacterium]|nr:hypothetical protein [candidate division WWE3 bacterium]
MRDAIAFFSEVLGMDQEVWYRRDHDLELVPIPMQIPDDPDTLDLVGLTDSIRSRPIRLTSEMLTIDLIISEHEMEHIGVGIAIGIPNVAEFVEQLACWCHDRSIEYHLIGTGPRWLGVRFSGFIGCSIAFNNARIIEEDPL